MKPISRRAMLVVVLLSLSANNGVCSDHLNAARISRDARRAIDNRTLFLKWNHEVWKCSDSELQFLIMDDNDTVSITSAFELFVIRPARKRDVGPYAGNTARLGEERLSPPPRNWEKGGDEINVSDATRFVGFCEGRLRIVFPDWFVAVLESGVPRGRRRITSFHFPEALDRLIVWHDVSNVDKPAANERTRDFVFAPARIDKVFANPPNAVKLSAGNVLLAGEWAQLTLPISAVNHDTSSKKGFAFAHDAHKFWVSVYNRDVTIPGHVLMCFDNNDVLWEKDVWERIDSAGFRLPAGNQLVSTVKQDGVVYVIGASRHGVYIEGFQAETGKCMMRFMSSLAPDSEDSR
jgi:hypothetical protein